MLRKAGLFLLSCLLFVLPLCASMEFSYRISNDDVFMITERNVYLVQPESIVCRTNMLYFAAQDFTARRELLVNRTSDIKVITDEDDRKVLRVTFQMGDGKDVIYDDYELVLFLEIRRGKPFLAIYSKFFYTGSANNECGINWAMESTHTPYRYYTIPHRGELRTDRLIRTRRTKIGQANWLFANTGDGTGGGLIAPALLLGRGENFIFMNSVPPKRRLARGESLDAFMIFMPINRNFRILPELFEQIKDIRWEY